MGREWLWWLGEFGLAAAGTQSVLKEVYGYVL